jgi:glucose/arabinose dehydrogenase
MGPGELRRAAAGIVASLVLMVACSDSEPSPPVDEGIRSTPSPTEETEGVAAPSAPRLKRLRIDLKEVASGFEAPLFVTHAGDGSRTLFVIEQVGRIRIVAGGRPAPQPFLDISDRITSGGEQGLLGLAFHPDYSDNGLFFVNYTDEAGDTIVSRFERASATEADPSSETILFRIGQPYPNHNGGALAFGPDGYLYIATGDGGSGGDPQGNGQSLDTLLGKMLRIDVDGGSGERAYSIPEDNPFIGEANAREEIWAYGMRNPWRFSFDRTGIWIADVGQDELEEVNRMPVDEGGLNYGWNVMEGDACYEPPSGCRAQGLVLPIATYSHDLGCSVTGGHVYRGSKFPEMVGAYLFGDYCSGAIWGLRSGGRSPQEPVPLMSTGRSISSFGVTRGGELLLTDIAAGDVLRVVTR